MNKYIITLSDGTEVNAEMNGNCFITEGEVEEEIFSEDNLYDVTIKQIMDDETESETTHETMVCTNFWTAEDGKIWFIIRDKSYSEIKETELNAKIEFLMAMQGVNE